MGFPDADRPLRVLIAAHGYPPRQAAGAEWRAHRLANGLHGQGHRVDVLAIDRVDLGAGAAPRMEQEGEGPRVHRLSLEADQAPGQESEFRGAEVATVFRELASQIQPDLVHVISGHRLGGGVLEEAARLGIPAVVTLTDFWFACPRIILRRATGENCDIPDDPSVCAACVLAGRRRFRWAHALTGGLSSRALAAAIAGGIADGPTVALRERLTDRRSYLMSQLGGAARVVAPSRFMARTFAGQGLDPDRLVVMRQGLAPASAVAPPASPRRTDGALRVGYIGQVAEHKGLFDLLAAFRRLAVNRREARLLVFGDIEAAWPTVRRRLLREAATLDAIELRGPFDHRDIRTVHAGLDVLVVPSKWYENSPNVILEAFACGTPVIAADLGGMAELVEHEVSGLLFDAARPVKGIATALERLAGEPGLLDRLRAGLPAVKTLDEEMDELETLYRQVLAERAEAR